MIQPSAWRERTWVFGVLPAGAFPAVLERLRGTGPRAADLVSGIPDARLRTRPGTGWSAKQHLGHLDDLHELDEQRLEEFIAGVDALTAADMSNRRTHEADHNDRAIDEIITRLRAHRVALVDRMDRLTAAQVSTSAMHPRLGQPMRLIDWAYFVAEHDDHHLAAARRALSAL
jgi:DinB superfamily